MFDQLVLRASFGGVLALTATAMFALNPGGLTMPSFGQVAPLLSALALGAAIIGWRLLHRELLKRTEGDARLRARMQRLDDAMQHSIDGVFLLQAVRTTDGVLVDLEITDANTTGARLCRSTPEAMVGQRLRRDLAERDGDDLFARYARVMHDQTPIIEDQRVDGRRFSAGWVMHHVIPTSNGVAVTLRDITDRKREEVQLRKASLTDDLTRLYNRRGFMTLADQQLRIARRQGKDAVVLYADMDGFKQLNDVHGHGVGDRALQAVGRLLQSTVRDCDVVARLGGDEFTILALDADGVGARIIQKRIEERLAVLNATGAFPAPIALTIGYTRVRPTDPASIVELLARADQLLYSRKRRRQLTRTAADAGVGLQHITTPSESATNGRDARVSPATRATRTSRRNATRLPTSVPPEVAAVATAMASARGLLSATPSSKAVPSSLAAPAADPLAVAPTHTA